MPKDLLTAVELARPLSSKLDCMVSRHLGCSVACVVTVLVSGP